MALADFSEILRRLTEGDVEFVVVGMTAGILQGAPVTTLDLDVVHHRTPENVSRLLRVLVGLEAVFRHDTRRLRPEESHLIGPGHLLLRTTLGDLDCLGTIDQGRGYEQLLGLTVAMEIEGGRTIRVLKLSALIEAKELAGRPKDMAALPVLRATLEESQRQS